MKSSRPKYNHHSCCLIVTKRKCCKHEEGCLENDLAMGWVINDENYDDHAKVQLFDALEQLGFVDGLARRV